jgi:hypothetical protein
MLARRFPPPWSVEDIGGCFVVKASNNRPLVSIYYRDGIGRRCLARLLTRNAARRIAAGIAKLPELLRRAERRRGPQVDGTAHCDYNDCGEYPSRKWTPP